MITPFSSRTRFTTIGRIDVGLMGVFFAINASIVSSANFLVTYRYLSTLNNRKMRDARSFFFRIANCFFMDDDSSESYVSYKYNNAFVR
jgi:hypothetical protein